MANVTLLYSQTCGACPAAKELWKGLRVKHSFSYREVDILSPDGQELVDRHAIRATPATIIDGKLKFIGDRKSTRLNSSHLVISYAVFCLKKKKPFQPRARIGLHFHLHGPLQDSTYHSRPVAARGVVPC